MKIAAFYKRGSLKCQKNEILSAAKYNYDRASDISAVAERWVWSKSAKFTKTREIPQNLLEILPNNVVTTYLKVILAVGAAFLLETC